MKFPVYGETDIGCVRRANEDAISCFQSEDGSFSLAVLADGMGGYEGGGIASELAVDSFQSQLLTLLNANEDWRPASIENFLLEAGRYANEAVFQRRESDENLAKMGTTLLVMLAYKDQFSLLHAGDSRCYSWDGQLQQLTRDDSVVQQMLDDGAISQQEAERVPYRNMLTKALGIDKDIDYTVSSAAYPQKGLLLLCSDGLFNALDDGEIISLLTTAVPLQEKTHSLIAASIANQASDNVSVILVQGQQ